MQEDFDNIDYGDMIDDNNEPSEDTSNVSLFQTGDNTSHIASSTNERVMRFVGGDDRHNIVNMDVVSRYNQDFYSDDSNVQHNIEVMHIDCPVCSGKQAMDGGAAKPKKDVKKDTKGDGKPKGRKQYSATKSSKFPTLLSLFYYKDPDFIKFYQECHLEWCLSKPNTHLMVIMPSKSVVEKLSKTIQEELKKNNITPYTREASLHLMNNCNEYNKYIFDVYGLLDDAMKTKYDHVLRTSYPDECNEKPLLRVNRLYQIYYFKVTPTCIKVANNEKFEKAVDLKFLARAKFDVVLLSGDLPEPKQEMVSTYKRGGYFNMIENSDEESDNELDIEKMSGGVVKDTQPILREKIIESYNRYNGDLKMVGRDVLSDLALNLIENGLSREEVVNEIAKSMKCDEFYVLLNEYYAPNNHRATFTRTDFTDDEKDGILNEIYDSMNGSNDIKHDLDEIKRIYNSSVNKQEDMIKLHNELKTRFESSSVNLTTFKACTAYVLITASPNITSDRIESILDKCDDLTFNDNDTVLKTVIVGGALKFQRVSNFVDNVQALINHSDVLMKSIPNRMGKSKGKVKPKKNKDKSKPKSNGKPPKVKVKTKSKGVKMRGGVSLDPSNLGFNNNDEKDEYESVVTNLYSDPQMDELIENITVVHSKESDNVVTPQPNIMDDNDLNEFI